MADKDARFYAEPAKKHGDYRTPSERDHDRILYSSAFRRLANVTQVTHVHSGSVIHNRLTHSLKVGRIARGLALNLNKQQAEIAEKIGGIDPVAAECAGLAHDIGHPPFGHVSEHILDELLLDDREPEGFEGNAQTFRVLTKLCVRREDEEGLNLTRRTLNAVLKYPWMRGTSGKANKKWGAYSSESAQFVWAREGMAEKTRSIEAELMDYADDIAYSTHDVEDYYRAGLIPLDRLLTDEREVTRFLEATFLRLRRQSFEINEAEAQKTFEELLKAVIGFFPDDLTFPYAGGRRQRAAIHSLVSHWINRFISGITLSTDGTPVFDARIKTEITLLKQLVWNYVIENPLLTDKVYGQKKVIKSLFEIFREAAEENELELFPLRYREQIEQMDNVNGAVNSSALKRVVADVIAEMTEAHAYDLYRRFHGFSESSILDFTHK